MWALGLQGRMEERRLFRNASVRGIMVRMIITVRSQYYERCLRRRINRVQNKSFQCCCIDQIRIHFTGKRRPRTRKSCSYTVLEVTFFLRMDYNSFTIDGETSYAKDRDGFLQVGVLAGRVVLEKQNHTGSVILFSSCRKSKSVIRK